MTEVIEDGGGRDDLVKSERVQVGMVHCITMETCGCYLQVVGHSLVLHDQVELCNLCACVCSYRSVCVCGAMENSATF